MLNLTFAAVALFGSLATPAPTPTPLYHPILRPYNYYRAILTVPPIPTGLHFSSATAHCNSVTLLAHGCGPPLPPNKVRLLWNPSPGAATYRVYASPGRALVATVAQPVAIVSRGCFVVVAVRANLASAPSAQACAPRPLATRFMLIHPVPAPTAAPTGAPLRVAHVAHASNLTTVQMKVARVKAAHAAPPPKVARGAPHGLPSSSDVIASIRTLFTPQNFGFTTNPSDCASHDSESGAGFSGMICSGAFQAGSAIVVWSPVKGAGGYNVYRVDAGRHDLVDSPASAVTFSVLPKYSDGYNGKCFAVTTVVSGVESSPSAFACAGAGTAAKTITVQPTQMLTRRTDVDFTENWVSDDPTLTFNSDFAVGYNYLPGTDSAGDDEWGSFYRSGILFDLSSLMNHTIEHAELKLSARESDHEDEGTAVYLSPVTCAAYVDTATDRWWENHDFDTANYLAPGLVQGPDFSFDVTSAVQQWTTAVANQPNFGFILVGDTESTTPQAIIECVTYLQSASLVITYF